MGSHTAGQGPSRLCQPEQALRRSRVGVARGKSTAYTEQGRPEYRRTATRARYGSYALGLSKCRQLLATYSSI